MNIYEKLRYSLSLFVGIIKYINTIKLLETSGLKLFDLKYICNDFIIVMFLYSVLLIIVQFISPYI